MLSFTSYKYVRLCAGLAILSSIVVLECGRPAFSVEKPSAFETTANQAILLDYDTNTVLFERKADETFAPASLVKVMTAALVFRELKEGRLNLDGDMVVSTNAWRKGGAVSGAPNMLLTPNKIVKVSELVTGLTIGSANDAAITLAENISGTEARFAQSMTEYAQQIGLESLTFTNATGFAQEGQGGSLRDYARLTLHIIKEYPEFYTFFGQKDMPLGKNRQANRNPLIAMDIGADGVMGGNLPSSGFHIIASSIQEGRRLILVATGFETAQERALEARKLLEWGHRRFELRTLYKAGEKIGEVMLYGGTAWAVDVRTPKDVRVPVLRGSTDHLVVRLAYTAPVIAPLSEGASVAKLQILLEGRLIQEAPLEAAMAIPKGGVISRAGDAIFALTRRFVLDGFKRLFDQMSWRAKPPASAQNPQVISQ